ncbi:MarR family winged helix-turn-helix transcriptional regulator [Streptococcus pluranimalium]|uniref:MarR family winged helix-turn-helix transcriptional regulator n=1 Tax=Streptococcus pluranimalium TaxID=82348 RepID=UPI00292DBB70|nr:MarR family transcriptional regulator [Streptococcus pluranimalium]MDY3041401.1 MarR family transcriptional regulator [Streptococcus pluranimalium]HEM6116913.1 MarR family transcriptional regulator [Streptococcus suis]
MIQTKSYIRAFDDLMSTYDYYARQNGLQSKSLQMLLWLYHYPKRNEKNITQQFLVRKTQSSKQVVNATIKSWGKKGFLELIENPDDKRHKFIRLTPLGQSYAQKVILPLEQMEKASFQILSNEEQDLLNKLTRKYTATLKQEMEKVYDSI